MTLQEAIKSGQVFKRPMWPMQVRHTSKGIFEVFLYGELTLAASLDLFPEDLLANDYEVNLDFTK